jgi:hypothetical protein
MNASKTSNPNAAPALFGSVRSSRDLTLVAVAGALLAAFALHAGAFVPPLSEPARGTAPRLESASRPSRPAVVARRPVAPRPASAAAPAEPCPAPRG